MTLLGVADSRPQGEGENSPFPLREGGWGLRSRRRGFLTDYLPPNSWVALVEPADLKEQGKHFFERVADPSGLFLPEAAFANLLKFPNVTVTALPRPSVEASAHLRVESVERFSGNVHRVRDELDADRRRTTRSRC